MITTRGSYLGGWIHVHADDVQIGFRHSQTTTERNAGSGTVSVFGQFQVDLQREELFKEGSQVRIPSKVFPVLLALVERPGEIVTREALRARLWPGGRL